MTKPILATALLFAATAFHAETPAPPPSNPVTASLGDWRTGIGAIVRIAPCGASSPDLCLHIVKLSPNPPQLLDVHNPDPALRPRDLVCMSIGSGFHQTDPDRLGAGHLYDPITGHTYRGYITPTDPDTLKLRGYVLFTLFGRTETWHRVPPVPTCK
jgi:uncharacterized protein (DUF2147 family)